MFPYGDQNMYGFQNMNQYGYEGAQMANLGNQYPVNDYTRLGYQQQPLSNLNQIYQNYYYPKQTYQNQQSEKAFQDPYSLQAPNFYQDQNIIQNKENQYAYQYQNYQKQIQMNPPYQQNMYQKPKQTNEVPLQYGMPIHKENQEFQAKAKPEEKKIDNSQEYFYRQLLLQKKAPEVSKIIYSKEVVAKEKILKKENFIGLSHDNVWDYYQALKLIGKGSFGEVYEAICKKTKQRRAVKKISKSIIKTKPKLRAQMKKEFDILRKLDHPNIMKMYEAFESANSIYIVTEYLSGGTLLEYFEKNQFSEHQIANVFLQLIRALAYCHGFEVAHRDLKPENLMYELQPPNCFIKLIDFGLSSFIQKDHKFHEILGSPMYMPPEIVNKLPYNEKCDIWSAGIILFYLLTRMFPYNGNTVEQINEQIKAIDFSSIYFSNMYFYSLSANAKSILIAMLNKDPNRRPSAKELLNFPFLKFDVSPSIVSKAETKLLLKNFIDYNQQSKLQRMVRNYIAANSQISKKYNYLRKIFLALDKKGDGHITFKQILDASEDLLEMFNLTREDLKVMCEKIDAGKNGYIDYTEFLAAAIDHSLMDDEKSIESVFDFLDKDHDGFINKADLQQVFKGDYGNMQVSVNSIMLDLNERKSDKVSKKEFIIAVKNTTRRESVRKMLQEEAHDKPAEPNFFTLKLN